MMYTLDIFQQKAQSGYTVCFTNQCPLQQQCLRWRVGQSMPDNQTTCRCVNPRLEGVATSHCTMYRPDEKVLMAKGMEHIFTDDMPKKVEPAVRGALISRYNRTYFFEYRNGSRLIPPAMQEEIRNLFRQHGWTQEVQFDEYIEDYAW